MLSRPPPSGLIPTGLCLPAGITPAHDCTVGNYALSDATRATQGRQVCHGRRSYRPVVSSAHGKSAAVTAVMAALDAGLQPEPAVLREAVRTLLSDLAGRAPGRSVEVRVPPYGAIQCVPGPRHTRGTPPNVVETDPLTWVGLATGRLSWTMALGEGRVYASGNRADISDYLPLRS